MSEKVTKKTLEEALKTYADLVELYPDNEAYLKRYAEMLQAMNREATATAIRQRLYDLIAARSEEEARAFAAKHPEIGRISVDDAIFTGRDKHIIAGEIISELLGTIWTKLHQKSLKEGQAVCKNGEASDSIIVVLDGKVDAYAIKDENTRMLVESIGPLDILGEATFFKPGALNFDAFVSSEKARIVKVPRQKLEELVNENDLLRNMLSQRSLFRTNIHAIARCEPFHTLPLKLSKHLARKLTLRKHKAGTLIYSLHQTMEGADIILSGQACHMAKNKEEKKLLLPPLELTSLVGDITLKGSKATSDFELYAKTDVTTAHIPYAEILNVSVAYPLLKERLANYLASQQSVMMKWLSQIDQNH